MSTDAVRNIAFAGPWLLVGPVRQALMLLYLGPDTVMPLASILAAIIGIVLVFWRRLLKPFKKTKAAGDQPLESAAGDSQLADLHDAAQK